MEPIIGPHTQNTAEANALEALKRNRSPEESPELQAKSPKKAATGTSSAEIRRIWSRLVHIEQRLTDSQSKEIVSHKVELASMDELAALKARLQILQGKGDRTIPTDSDDGLTEVPLSHEEQMSEVKQSLLKLHQELGFSDVMEALEVTVGVDWSRRVVVGAQATLQPLKDSFVPTRYELAKVEVTEEESIVLVGKTSGTCIDEDAYRLDAWLPYVTDPCFFDGDPVWTMHELYIPFESAKGKNRVLVLQGYFRPDCSVVRSQFPIIRQKIDQTLLALKDEAIADQFKRNWLDNCNLGGLLANDPYEIAENLGLDYLQLQSLSKMKMTKLAPKWTKQSTREQIRWMSLLLMGEDSDKRHALFLHSVADKVDSKYARFVVQSLPFALRKELSHLIYSMEESRQKLAQLKPKQISWEDRIMASGMPDEVKALALDKAEELRLEPRSAKLRKWLDGILKVGFGSYSPLPVDLESAPSDIKRYFGQVRGILDDHVYGHDTAKETVVEWVAQRISNGESGGDAIAFQGPPGNGKTSLARAMAKALNRPLVFITLGGRSDASYLIGHSFTYSGAHWGKIVAGLQKSGCMDPIFYFDELDKVAEKNGVNEINGVLTHLVDATQSDQFNDMFYQDVEFDLSRALFLFSYNDENVIDPILKDRMITIRTDGLSEEAKLVVAQSYLMPELTEEVGFRAGEMSVDDETVRYIIQQYTREQGVRRLKEHLKTILRKLNRQRLEEPETIGLPCQINKDTVEQLLDEPKDITWEDRVLGSDMPDEVKAVALEKAKSLKTGKAAGLAKKWLTGILKISFGKYNPLPITRLSPGDDIKQYLGRVRGVMDESVYGHDRAKETVIEWVAQRISNGASGGEAIGLQGPPGNGKTSLARALAKALDRPLVFIGLGGRKDSAYLVGHSFTYTGAHWGKIVAGLQQCGCMDPIFYFDELDKVAEKSGNNELTGVLTHLVDSTQSDQFNDLFYQDVHFDLSRALFFFSYNNENAIDPILKDRMITIRTEGLVEDAKLIIAHKHLIPDLAKEVGFQPNDVSIDDETVKYIVRHYTEEEGVRRLKENLKIILRKLNRRRLEEPESVQLPYRITKKDVKEHLEGPKSFSSKSMMYI